MSLILRIPKAAKPSNKQSAAGRTEVLDAPSRPGNVATVSATQPANVAQNRNERRKQRRAGVKLGVRVRLAELSNGGNSEVLLTVNASRQNLYFTTTNKQYTPGKRLRVTFPYNSEHDSVSTSEEEAEVVRTEVLPDNLIGVAIELRGPSRNARPATGVARRTGARPGADERRIATRQPFSSAAVVVDADANIRLEARCSDLSLEGCYVDTLNPFPVGRLTRVELRRGDRTFDSVARVSTSQSGMGMGLAFQDLTAQQTAMLTDWMNNEHGEDTPNMEPRAAARPAESPDRAMALNLVRQLLAKGVLTKTDLSDMIVNQGIF